MRLIAVGRARGEEAALFARYAGRLRPALTLTEIPDAAGAPAEARRREGEALLAAVPSGSFLVALDLGPPAPDSVMFSRLLERWLGSGRSVCFVIGGADGLDPSVIGRADHVLSLGPLTWPHLLVRVMLAEQLFRARAIASGHPYHREWRP